MKQRSFKYSQLAVAKQPDVTENVTENVEAKLTWEKRIYEATAFHPLGRTDQTVRQTWNIDPRQHSMKIARDTWKALLNSLDDLHSDQGRRRFVEKVKKCAASADELMTSDGVHYFREVTSEMRDGSSIYKHHVKFCMDAHRSDVLQVQMVADCQSGFLQLQPCLVNLTKNFAICVLHRREPIKCFSDVATNSVKKQYKNTTQYKEVLLPILSMESASKTVTDNDPVVVNKVNVRLFKNNKCYSGKFSLSEKFCKQRQIKLTRNSKDTDEESHDYLCIRHASVSGANSHLGEMDLQETWVAHALATYASWEKDKEHEANKVTLSFDVHEKHIPPPDCLLHKDGSPCTVEFLVKPLPNR
jgi:hypothetical protein